jgi:hypothetical protein
MAAGVDRCTLTGEQVIPQPGGVYGGWITSSTATETTKIVMLTGTSGIG